MSFLRIIKSVLSRPANRASEGAVTILRRINGKPVKPTNVRDVNITYWGPSQSSALSQLPSDVFIYFSRL